MATQVRMNPRWHRNDLGAEGPMLRGHAVSSTVGAGEEPYIKETAAQVYDVSDLVFFDTNGTIAVCTVTTSRLDSAILGLAARDATGTTGAPAFVNVIRESDVYMMNVFHSTLALSVTNQDQLGDVRGIILTGTVGTDSKWHVDIENAVEGGADSLARVKIVGFPVQTKQNNVVSTIGDTHGLVLVKFLPFSAASDFLPFQRILQG